MMNDRFPTLMKMCGGKLNPETLTEFQRAMREYEVFMAGMRELLRPIEGWPDEQEDRP